MLGELGEVEAWYQRECEKVQHQSRVDEFQQSENTSLYHHELHKRSDKKGAIIRLQTERGLLEGDRDCAVYLEGVVQDLLLNPAKLFKQAQKILLD